ncbi:MAG: hypothetical protein LW884_09855 [Bacteroidetes bacterium]|jgi:ribonuclease HI|nr:hypothetical protein [Bacteroidota bacterium]
MNPTYRAYVDGSWIAGRIGYGAVILDAQDQVLAQFSGPVPEDYAAGTRQVAGELVATGQVVRWCEQQGIAELHLYFDYLGIQQWATGGWKAKLDLTRRYRAFMQQTPVRLYFHKVKAHSGDYWNEYADQLAKQGASQARPA